MNTKVEEQVSNFDSLKWLVVLVLVGIGAYGNWLYGAESILYRSLALVAMAIVAILVALQTEKGSSFAMLAKEARLEIRKVVWPTKQETTQTTMIVVGVVIIMALILWLLDAALGGIIEYIIG